MSVAAVDFDPYRDWLKVDDVAHPLNAYQLLRLAPLEADLSKIRVGYMRQLDALDAKGDHGDGALIDRLRGELQQAFDLLCDQDRKAVLDAQLRRRTNTSVPQPSAEAVATAGHTVQCRRCLKGNSPNRRFCGDCGQPLWEKCPQCAAEVSVAERFCGGCGANIRGELEQKERTFREQLSAAKQAADALQFDAAISRFRKLAAIDDIRFESLAREALAAVEETEQRRATLQVQIEESFRRAQQLISEHSYEQAISILSDVPAALRTRELEKLLERSKSVRQELLQLSGEIRQAMEQKEYTGLLLKIERLLSLKPGHTQAQGIANQLREHFYKQAKAKVATCRYADAVDILTQIPESFRTPETNTLEDSASELAALLNSVQNEPLAIGSLQGIADKLGKFAPQNQEVTKLRQRLADRLAKAPSQERMAAADWQPAPVKSAIGPPVDWLAHFTRVQSLDEKVKSTLADHPGEFFIALGLALQGVEQAEVPLNLITAEKGSVLARFKSVFGRKSPAMVWGLDLGDHALKAIKLVRDEKTGQLHLAACEYISHERSLGGSDADMIRAEVQEKTLADFAGRNDLKGCQVIAAIAAQRVLGRFCELPPLPAKKVAAAVEFEAKHQFPIPLDELKWAYYVLDEAEGKAADEAPRRIMIVAARNSHVQERLALCKRAGIEVSVLQSECVALHNAIRFEFGTPPAAEEKKGDAKTSSQKAPPVVNPASVEEDVALAIVDIGVSSTSVLVSSSRGLWFRTFGQAGNNFTNQLAKQLQVTHEQAEQLKRSPSKARRYHLFLAATQPQLVQLAGEIERSLASYHKQNSALDISRVYGIGGGFQTHGLLRQLRFGK
ncbi:Competence protein A [Anatilimnocola aggregata]|uniref:Competence protein A n=1 Tax=Anatilimnocola aggregata TaxID=2528021 RepID=A0A517YJX6_9BACT|nr:pilus assembly protein PilM [Anatilimnocola aggregata]QDU30529.1 Competence protein A [Anatilimnocola aggregata]